MRLFDHPERGECADFDSAIEVRLDSSQRADAAQVENVLRFKKLLSHRGNHISAPSDNADGNVPGRRGRVTRAHTSGIRGQELNCFWYAPGTQQLELWKAQSAPPADAGASWRAGSSTCRSGPLPLKQSAPPCSRKRSGAVGSTPSVRFNALAFLLARSAASTRSGVKGHSCSRTPTAS